MRNTTTTPAVASGPSRGASTVRTTTKAVVLSDAATVGAGATTVAVAVASLPVSTRCAVAARRSTTSPPTEKERTLSWMVAWYLGRPDARSAAWLPTTTPMPPMMPNASSTASGTGRGGQARAPQQPDERGQHEGEQHREHHGDEELPPEIDPRDDDGGGVEHLQPGQRHGRAVGRVLSRVRLRRHQPRSHAFPVRRGDVNGPRLPLA